MPKTREREIAGQSLFYQVSQAKKRAWTTLRLLSLKDTAWKSYLLWFCLFICRIHLLSKQQWLWVQFAVFCRFEVGTGQSCSKRSSPDQRLGIRQTRVGTPYRLSLTKRRVFHHDSPGQPSQYRKRTFLVLSSRVWSIYPELCYVRFFSKVPQKRAQSQLCRCREE